MDNIGKPSLAPTLESDLLTPPIDMGRTGFSEFGMTSDRQKHGAKLA